MSTDALMKSRQIESVASTCTDFKEILSKDACLKSNPGILARCLAEIERGTELVAEYTINLVCR